MASVFSTSHDTLITEITELITENLIDAKIDALNQLIVFNKNDLKSDVLERIGRVRSEFLAYSENTLLKIGLVEHDIGTIVDSNRWAEMGGNDIMMMD